MKTTSAKNGSKVRVEYKSVLNENAHLGKPGNKNTMYMEFSNNPNNEQGGETGKTPEDTVIVFTYKVSVNKVNENGDKLGGADFTLEKKVNGVWTGCSSIYICAYRFGKYTKTGKTWK